MVVVVMAVVMGRHDVGGVVCLFALLGAKRQRRMPALRRRLIFGG